MLTRIRIDNFRCFSGFDFRPGPFNLILGPNGVGKSSLLDVLHAVCRLVSGLSSIDDLFPPESITRSARSDDQHIALDARIRDADFTYELVIARNRLGAPRIAREAVAREGKELFQFDGETVQIAGADRKARATYPYEGRHSPLATLPASNSTHLAAFIEWLRSLWVLRPVPALMRATGRTEDAWLASDLSNFAGWFRNLVLEEPRVTNKIRRSLRDVLDGFDDVTLSHETGRVRTLRFTFKDRRRKGLRAGPPPLVPSGFALDELSDGQRMLVALYAVLHYVVGAGRTLCIDEPENYLALPEIQPWLDEVRDLAVERGGQILVVSHHPMVIDLLAAEYGHWFDRKGTGPVRTRPISLDEEGAGIPLSTLVARGWVHG